ncbi:hypothetical protein [Pseudomonas khavaziana]|uniref:Uncharacterized protein n=1 Tax=Pseudomonas khavaziana TaxID=2842351 RepID=A0ABZ2DBN1_9PSED
MQPAAKTDAVGKAATGNADFNVNGRVVSAGQRYINGIINDDQLFRYLMDNAISYKDSPNLQLEKGGWIYLIRTGHCHWSNAHFFLPDISDFLIFSARFSRLPPQIRNS